MARSSNVLRVFLFFENLELASFDSFFMNDLDRYGVIRPTSNMARENTTNLRHRQIIPFSILLVLSLVHDINITVS